MGIAMGGGLQAAKTPPRRRSSRPNTAFTKPLVSPSRPQTAPARPQTTPRKSPRERISPYSPRHRLSPRTTGSLSRPQTAGEPFALHSSAWGMKPMPAGTPASSRSRASEASNRSKWSQTGYDRETLMKELYELKKLVAEQNREQKKQKLRACAAEHENRKLERDLLDLELKGIADALAEYDSPFLREKLQEFKARISFLQRACRRQNEELCLLRRDVRGTHTKELEMERDVFEEEAHYLQRTARKLAAIQVRLSAENKEIQQMKEKNEQLEEVNQQVQANITELFSVIQKVNQHLATCRFRTSESSIASKRHIKKAKDIRRRALAAESAIQRLKDQKYRFQMRMSILRKKLAASRKELAIVLQERDKARANQMKKFMEEQGKAVRSPRHKSPRRSPRAPDDDFEASIVSENLQDRATKEKYGKKD